MEDSAYHNMCDEGWFKHSTPGFHTHVEEGFKKIESYLQKARAFDAYCEQRDKQNAKLSDNALN